MDVNNCNYCLQTASILSDYPDLLNSVSFLFSPEDVTLKQAIAYVNEELHVKAKVVVNTEMYRKCSVISPTASSRKIPKVIFFNSATQQIVRTFALDSIRYYRNSIRNFLAIENVKYKPINHSIKSIKNLIGYKALSCANGNLVVNTYQNPRKVFFFNAKQKQLSSFVIDTILEKRIFQLNNIDIEHFATALMWHRQNGFTNFSSFITNQVLTDSTLSGVIVTRYYDYESLDSILSPVQIFQFFNYHIRQKDLQLYGFNDLYSGDSISDELIVSKEEFYQEFDYPFMDINGNWNTFINFQPTDSFSKTKMVVKFAYHSNTKLYEIDSIVHTIKFDTIATFTGDKFNDPSFYFDYKFRGNLFYYHNAPLIRNVKSGTTLNLLHIDSTITWVDDLLTTNDGVFYVLTNSKQGHILLLFDESTNTLLAKRKMFELDVLLAPKAVTKNKSNEIKINSEAFELEPSTKVSVLKSNLVLDSDLSVYFVDNQGLIRQLTRAK